MVKQGMVFWSISGNFVYRHHVEPIVKLYVPRGASFSIPSKCIDVTRATSTSLDVMLETNMDDYWNVDGDREIVRYVVSVYKIHDIGWITTRLTYMVREEIDKKANDIQTRLSVARNLERHVRSVEAKRKAKVGYQKFRSLTVLDNCVLFISLIPRKKNSRKLLKKTRSKLEKSDASSNALQKLTRRVQWNLQRFGKIVRQSTHASLKPTNLRECVRKELFIKVMNIILQGEEIIHWTITFLGTKFFLCLKKWKDAKSSGGQRMRQTWKDTSMTDDESQKQKRGDRWSKERRQNRALCVVHRHLSSQEFGVATKFSKNRGDIVSRWFRLLRSIHWIGFISIINDGSKSSKCHSETTRMRRTSSERSVSLHPSQKWKMHRRYFKFPSQNVQIFGYVYRNTSGLNHGPAWKTQPFFLSEICTVSFWQDYYGKGNSRKFHWNTVGRRFQSWNVFS